LQVTYRGDGSSILVRNIK